MRKITWLTGDYANVNDRQNQAAARGCAVTVDFHFNGNGADAKGGEVWYKPGDARAKMLGQAIVDAYSDLELPFHGNEPLKEAVPGNRASFIRHYEKPAVLIEPLFVTNPSANQAGWIHDADNVQALAQKIAVALEAAMSDENSVIGRPLSIFTNPPVTGIPGSIVFVAIRKLTMRAPWPKQWEAFSPADPLPPHRGRPSRCAFQCSPAKSE